MSKMDRKQVRLDKRQHKWLKRAAKARGVPQAEVIREAIDFYIAAQTESTARAKQKRARKANATSTPPRRTSPRAPKPSADSPSKWHGDDPHEERLRQIEQLTR
jgi:predicted DNA-binding protein